MAGPLLEKEFAESLLQTVSVTRLEGVSSFKLQLRGRQEGRRSSGGGESTQAMHGRSRMAIDPRIPTMSGRSTSGFSPTRRTLLVPSVKCPRPGRHRLHQARSKRREVWAGMADSHPWVGDGAWTRLRGKI